MKGALDLDSPLDGKSILTYVDYYSSNPEAYILHEVTSREEIMRWQIYSLDLDFKSNSFLTTENSLFAGNLKRF